MLKWVNPPLEKWASEFSLTKRGTQILPPDKISVRKEQKNMCLAIPAKIIEIENEMGTIDMEGMQRKASLLLLEDAKIGDYVIVHAGFAIHKIDETEAMESLKVLREMASLASGENT